MFTPSSCQELSKQQPVRRHPVFPSGTHDLLVGGKDDVLPNVVACRVIDGLSNQIAEIIG